MSAPTFITTNVIPADQLTQEKCLMQDIHQLIVENDLTIQWLAGHGLIANTQQCCNRAMILMFRGKSKDGKVWRCRSCRRERSIRNDSFFSGSHISLPKLLKIMYWWAEVDCTQSVVMERVGIASEAIVNWYNYFRDIACMYVIDHPTQIGGPGVDVEIDESKFMHRRDHHVHEGRYHEGHKVMGLIERGTYNCVLVPVADCSASTLIPIIIQHCLPGTRIIMDGGKAYNRLQDNAVINNNISFLDPNDSTVQTNPIEGNWSSIKTKYRNKHRTSNGLWNTYLQEFVFRRVFAENFFMNFIFWIRHYYPM